jgi:redox-sensitive bicupin YhaK (pirin superfamily)
MSADIPNAALASGAGSVRVIAGDFQGTKGPAKTFTPIYVWDLQLAAGPTADFHVPAGHTSLVVVQKGSVRVNDSDRATAGELVAFERAGDRIKLEAEGDAQALVLSGEPLNEPVYGQGPFVMNTREQIQQAIHDYHAGRMGRLS